jgi:hypothetical protein
LGAKGERLGAKGERLGAKGERLGIVFFKSLPIGTLLWKTFLMTCNDTCMYTKGEKLGGGAWASALQSICGEHAGHKHPVMNCER